MSGKSSFTRMTEAVSSLKSAAKIEACLKELLTPTELHDLALRWEIVELLSSGVPQRQVGTKLGVSLCKITRGAKILKEKDGIVAKLVASKAPAAKKVEKKNGTRVTRKSED